MGKYKPTPNYIARKSIFPAFWTVQGIVFLVLLVVTIISLILSLSWVVTAICGAVSAICFLIVLSHIVRLRFHTIEFYNGHVIEKWGVFIRNSRKTVFPRITGISTRRNILGYGDIFIDVVGPSWDISFRAMSRPNKLRNFLSYYMLTDSAIENISSNPYIAATDGLFR